MLNADTKRHIDAARDVLVGVAPNPMTQIDQITYALIYKFMDDMDEAAIKAGGERSFFTGDLAPYAWSNLVDTRIGSQEKMDLFADALTKFAEAPQLPELFRTIFRAAFLPYRSPETLGLFIKEINYFDYSHPEELGNAYEYLLSIMSSQGDAGQFRTPRHIIDFMVDVLDPTKDDTILDPACGTGGFLVSSYNHILEKHDGKDDPNGNEKPLTPAERKKLTQNLAGYDIDPSMVRIAQVNMYLHQFKNPQIFQYDGLTSEERWNDKFDVILANPPFMSPKGGIKPHNKFGIQSNRAEVLFVDYIASHLKPTGRAAIVVPEGIIFQSGKAYKELRKNLVENGLYAVVSLPGGVFQPYSGVKTSILFINKVIASKKTDIAFIKIGADGFDLGATKRVVSKNDLPAALQILGDWCRDEAPVNPIFSTVSKEEIAAKSDYNLSGESYVTGTDYTNSKWLMTPLEKVTHLITDGSHNPPKGIASSDFMMISSQDIQNGSIEINKPRYLTEADFVLENKRTSVQKNDVLLTTVGTIGRCAVYEGFPSNLTFQRSVTVIRPIQNLLNAKFLMYVLQGRTDFLASQARGVAQKGLYLNQVRELQVPVPPLEFQEQIVAELDGYAAIISGAKQIVENWKPTFDLESEWPVMKLQDVAKWTSGGTPKAGTPEYYDGEIPWSVIGDLNEDVVIETKDKITNKGLSESSAKVLPKGTVMLAMYGASIGKTGIMGKPMATNQAIACGQVNPAVIDRMFLLYYLQGQKSEFVRAGTGGAQPNISQGIVKEWPVPVPPLSVQEQVLLEIADEKAHVDSAKKLIETYEAKTQAVIAKLWSE
jgi:type I restriction enzyme M protein